MVEAAGSSVYDLLIYRSVARPMFCVNMLQGLSRTAAPPGCVRVVTLVWDGSLFKLTHSEVLGGSTIAHVSTYRRPEQATTAPPRVRPSPLALQSLPSLRPRPKRARGRLLPGMVVPCTGDSTSDDSNSNDVMGGCHCSSSEQGAFVLPLQ